MLRGQAVDRVIHALAAPTCSVVHGSTLRAAGISRNAVHHRVRAGTMAAVLPRTYAVGPGCTEPTPQMRCMAGVLFAGPGAVVTGEEGARQVDLWDRGVTEAIDIAVPGSTRRCGDQRYRFHRTGGPWVPAPARRVGPIPVAGIVDLCIHLARTLTKWQLASVVDRARYRGLIDLDQLERLARSRCRHPWIATLHAAVDLVRSGSCGTRSASEDHFLDAVLDAGLPEPLVNVRGILGLSRDEPDFYWPHRRLNIEIDGGHHDEPAQQRDDRQRDAEAARLGITVVRVRAADVWRNRAAVVRAVAGALDGRGIECDAVTRRLRRA